MLYFIVSADKFFSFYYAIKLETGPFLLVSACVCGDFDTLDSLWRVRSVSQVEPEVL